MRVGGIFHRLRDCGRTTRTTTVEPMAEFDIERPLPPLWNEFDVLARVPILVIRGANSDILSAATLTAMQARNPDMESIEVADQGHVPLFGDDVVSHTIEFVAKCEAHAIRKQDMQEPRTSLRRHRQ